MPSEAYKSGMSEAQIWLMDYLRERYPTAVILPEYEFAKPERKWRFDVAAFTLNGPLAFEVEGVGRTQDGKYGRHQSIGGFIADMEKYNHATARGFRVFRFTTKQILKGEVKAILEKYQI